jgi:hypothetical protein
MAARLDEIVKPTTGTRASAYVIGSGLFILAFISPGVFARPGRGLVRLPI